jgi:hypothetical protein
MTMAKKKKPQAPKATPPPAMPVDAAFAGEAEKKSLKSRKGGLSAWITRGQSLGGGSNLG